MKDANNITTFDKFVTVIVILIIIPFWALEVVLNTITTFIEKVSEMNEAITNAIISFSKHKP